MTTEGLRIREVNSVDDSAWPAWLEIYHASFPEPERMTDGYFERLLVREAGDAPESHVLILEAESPLGIAFYETDPELEAGFLWYMATRAGERGRGLGALLYQHILRQVRESGMRLLLFEVEIPEPGEAGSFADRRIAWYRRQGARLLGGVEYFQTVDSTPEPVPMHLMAHPLRPMTPQAVFEIASRVFADALRQTGPPALT